MTPERIGRRVAGGATVSVYEGHGVTLHHGDCLDILRTLPDASVDAVVTDPPYLMRWLVRLVTPPGGVVLEPFAGSGTTVEACLLEGFRCIAVERESDYLPLVVARITRQRDPVAHVRLVGDQHLTLFDEDAS